MLKSAKALGLIDDIGHLVPIMKSKFGEKTRFSLQEKKRGFLSRFGIQIANETLGEIENHINWSRFGL